MFTHNLVDYTNILRRRDGTDVSVAGWATAKDRGDARRTDRGDDRRVIESGKPLEDIEEPVMREIRYLDKLVDELAKGKAMEKILRN